MNGRIEKLILATICLQVALPFILFCASSALADDYIRLTVKTGNLTSCMARMKQLGINVADATDEHGLPRQVEAYFERGNTPFAVDVNGDTWFTILLTSEAQADKLPKKDTPNYSIMWDSREMEQVGVDEAGEPVMQQKPRPQYEAQMYDENGDPAGTYMQTVGWI